MKVIFLFLFLFLTFTLLPAPPVAAQSVSGNTLALATLQKAYTALGASGFQSVKLTGTGSWSNSSPDSTGAITIEVVGALQSRLDIGAASITEVRDSSTALPTGQWRDAKSTVSTLATHNCWSRRAGFCRTAS